MSIRKNHLQFVRINNLLAHGIMMVLASLFVIGLGSVLLTAYYGVPIGDDYLAIKIYSNSHTWLYETWYSLTNTGRYMQSLTASITYGALRHHVAVLLPFITLAWLYALLYLYARLVFSKVKTPLNRLPAHLLSAAILLMIVTAGKVHDPHRVWMLYQPFFFSSAIVTYTFSVLLYLSVFYIYLRFYYVFMRKPILSLVVFGILAYLIGLYNETTPATVFGLSILLIAGSFIRLTGLGALGNRRAYLFTLAGSSLLALVTMYLSPANIARRHSTGAMQDHGIITPIITKVITAATQYTYRPTDFVFLAIIGMMIYFYLLHHTRRDISYVKLAGIGLAVVGGSFLSLVASISLLVMGYGPFTGIYPRTFLIGQIMFIIGSIILAVGLIGSAINKLPSRHQKLGTFVLLCGSLVLVIILGPHFLSKQAADLNGVSQYHETWIQQDALLKQAAITRPNDTIYLDDAGAGISDGFSVQCNSPFSSSTIWLTDAMEAYYGLREICSKSDISKP